MAINRIQKLLLLAGLAPFVGAFLLAAPRPAAAETVYCVNCATEGTAATILQAIITAQTRIVNAIQGSSTAQSQATVESAKIISDANTRTAADMKKLDAEIASEPLDPCGVTAAAKGGSEAASNRPTGSGRGAGGGGGGGGGTTPSAGASADMKKALEISNGDKPAPSPEVAAALAASGACSTFAKGTLREASCKGAGFSTNLTSGFPNADIRAETIFDGPQTASDIAAGVNRKLTIKAGNTPEKVAVNAYIRNLETPMDLRTLTPRELNSEAGRNYMALRDSYDAGLSLSTKPLRDQEALITANPQTKPILKQMMKGEDGRFIAGMLDKVFPSWQNDGVSYAQLMQLEASRRYLNEDWHVRIAGATEKQLLTEQVQLQALNSWMMVSLLERIQQMSILQGAAAGSMMRSEKMPLLVAAHRAAKTPGGGGN